MKTSYSRNNIVCSGYWRRTVLTLFILVGLITANGYSQCQVSMIASPASCFGVSDGWIAANPSGGTSPYTYSWATGAVSQTVNGLTAGTYTVTVVDAVGCTVTSTAVVLQPVSLQASATGGFTYCSTSNGTANAVGFGGTPQYTYLWSTGTTSSTLYPVIAGTYSVTVTDANGCTAESIAVINDIAGPNVTTSSTTSTCGITNGSATASASGGTGPFTYLWSNAAFGPTVNGLAAGTYTVTVYDANGCTAASTAEIVDQGSPFVTISGFTNPSTCGSYDGSLTASSAGGAGTHTYSWSNGATTNTADFLGAGTYSLTVVDANGCTVEASAALSCSSPIKYNSCGSNNAGEIDASSYACGGGTYQWSNGATTALVSGLGNGTYTVTITHVCAIPATEMVFVMTDSCDLVWPGDADRDLTADNNDLLSIGVGYGSTGNARPNASILWQGEGALDWGTALSNGADYKNVDCNGDGVINANDTTAVVNNFGLSHGQKVIEPEYIQTAPDLAFVMPVDTADSGAPVTIPITLGSSANPATNFYGIAFTINYDPTIVDTTNISLSLAGSWLGTEGVDMIKITKNFGAPGKLKVGITRIDHQNISTGYGVIGQTTMIMKDDIVPKLVQGANPTKTLNLFFSDIKAIQANETLVPVNQTEDSIVINILPTGIKNVSHVNDLKVYPVPAKDRLTITSSESKILSVTLTNVIGQNLLVMESKESNVSIDVQALPQGIFYLSVLTDSGRFVQKIYVEK